MKNSDWKTVDVPTHPRKKGRWVEVVAHIRKNETGEIRKSDQPSTLDNDEESPCTFIWREGAFSCGDNRRSFFETEAEGAESVDDDEYVEDSEYSVNLENPVTGEIYYREFE